MMAENGRFRARRAAGSAGSRPGAAASGERARVMKVLRRTVPLLLLSLLICLPVVVQAQEPGAERAALAEFYGHYAGQASFLTDSGAFKRDLDLKISRFNWADQVLPGFTLEWSFATFKNGSDSPGMKRYRYDFARVPPRSDDDTTELYVPLPHLASGKDLARSNDPRGEIQAIWANLSGRTLTVYALVVTDDGDYEMQVHNRTLTASGIDLEFARYNRGKRTRYIRATLKRVE